MTRSKLLMTVVASLCVLRGGVSLAQTADVVSFQNVDTVKVFFETVPALSTCKYSFYQFPGASVDMNIIVDAFEYPSGMFLQEGRPDNEEIGLRPAVLNFGPSFTKRKIVVVVRGQPGTSGMFHFLWECGPLPERSGDSGGYAYSSASGGSSSIRNIPLGMPTGTHVLTVEEPGGNSDTILMVLGDDGLPIAFDDDSGLAQMSFVHLSQSCPAGSCSILVARVADHAQKPGPAPTPGPVRLIWDADVHRFLGDRDGDGLGDGLEIVLGTCNPGNPNRDTDADGIPDCDDMDVDGDGLQDDVEVIGRSDFSWPPGNESTPTNPTRLHLYGADPLQRDLFVEADWQPGCDGGPPSCPPIEKGKWRLDSAGAESMAELMAQVARVHIDTGVENPGNPQVSGNWGGAELLADGQGGDYCDGATPIRDAQPSLFYHVVAKDSAQNKGRCSAIEGGAGANASVFVHETGHYFGLEHWGRTSDGANCKPHYPSVMSYVHTRNARRFLPGPYSSGAYSGLVLNPTSLDEASGIGADNSSGLLANILRLAFGRRVEETGAVDWNLDSAISATGTSVGGVLNYAGHVDCDRAPYWRRATVEFVRAVVPSVADTSDGLVVLALMRSILGLLDGRIYFGFPALGGCSSAGFGPCAEMAFSQTVKPSPAPALFPPSAAGDLVIYTDQNRNLYSMRFRKTTDPLGMPILLADAPKPMGGGPATGAPIAIKDDASERVLVFAPGARAAVGGARYFLNRWEYEPTKEEWFVTGASEQWANGDSVNLTSLDAGIGVTKGRLSTDPPGQFSIFGAIPIYNGPDQPAKIEIARLVRLPIPTSLFAGRLLYAEYWSKLDAGIWAPLQGAPELSLPGRVAMAFQPEGGEGRFYLSFKVPFGRYETQFITFTTGNAPWDGIQDRPDRALAFVAPTHFGNQWYTTLGGMSLVSYAGGIVGAAANPPCSREPCEAHLDLYPWSTFFPNANGIYNIDQTDFDDVTYIRTHMGCSLRRDLSCLGL